MLASLLSLLIQAETDETAPPINPIKTLYVTHSTIYISGDAEFDNVFFPNNGVVSGNGTKSNPYIIEEWEIEASSDIGIYIENSDVFFIIRGCHIYNGGYDYYGISLYNVKNGSVTGNNCSGNYYGVYLESSNNCTVSGNLYSYNDYGIGVQSSRNCTLYNNDCNNASTTGIILWNSMKNAIYGNNISNSTDYGLMLSAGSARNEIYDNNMSGNIGYGLYVATISTSNNTITNNEFYHNNGAGDTYDNAHVQAFDNGYNNSWDNRIYGNWWSDWTTPDNDFDGIVDSTYALDGNSGAVDNFPLASPPPYIPEFSDMIIPIAGLALIAVALGRKRKIGGG